MSYIGDSFEANQNSRTAKLKAVERRLYNKNKPTKGTMVAAQGGTRGPTDTALMNAIKRRNTGGGPR